MPTVEQARARYVLGVSLLIAVVFLWVASSFLMSVLFHSDRGDDQKAWSFDKPFAVTYLNTATFTLYLLPTLCSQGRRSGYSHLETGTPDASQTPGLQPGDETATQERHSRAIESNPRPRYPTRSSSRFSTQTRSGMWRLAGTFCILWFVANWSTNASLKFTDVGIVTVLSNLSGTFTLIFSVLTGVESMDWRKIGAVLMSLVGVIAISNLDATSTSSRANAWVGDALAVLGAALYGLYTTLLKAAASDNSSLDEKRFLGFVGLFNIVFLWPIFLVLDLAGIEQLALPSNAATWLLVAGNALLGTCLADYLWLKALILTTPLLVTLGLSLSIPLAVIGDATLGLDTAADKIGLQYCAGAAAILGSFILISSLEHKRVAREEI